MAASARGACSSTIFQVSSELPPDCASASGPNCSDSHRAQPVQETAARREFPACPVRVPPPAAIFSAMLLRRAEPHKIRRSAARVSAT